MSLKTEKTGALAFKAGIWYVVSNIMVKAMTVITTPVFTRLMSTAEYGTFQTFTSWYSLLLPVFTLNLTYSIGRAKLDYPDHLDDYLGSMQTLTALFSFAISAVALIFLRPVASLLELSPPATILLLIYLFAHSAILLYQNSYRYRYQYKQNIAIAWYILVVSVVLSLVLMVSLPGDRAELRMIGTTIAAAALSAYFWIKSIRHKWLHIDLEYWKYGLRISVPLVLHTISMHILSQSDRIFIAKIWGQEANAFYSLAYTYGVLLHVFTTAASEAWLPWFHDIYYAGKFEEIRKNVRPLVVLGCYIGLACIALAPEAIMILGGTKYAPSVPCVPPIVLGVVCQYVYTHYVNIELHLKRTIYVSYGTIFAAVLNIVLNAVFIPRYGFIAAAYTTLASYFALMIIHFIITRKVLRVKLYRESFMFGSLAVTAAVTALIMFSYDHTGLRYAILGAGFATFLFYFRNYIKKWIRKRKNRTQKESREET